MTATRRMTSRTQSSRRDRPAPIASVTVLAGRRDVPDPALRERAGRAVDLLLAHVLVWQCRGQGGALDAYLDRCSDRKIADPGSGAPLALGNLRQYREFGDAVKAAAGLLRPVAPPPVVLAETKAAEMWACPYCGHAFDVYDENHLRECGGPGMLGPSGAGTPRPDGGEFPPVTPAGPGPEASPLGDLGEDAETHLAAFLAASDGPGAAGEAAPDQDTPAGGQAPPAGDQAAPAVRSAAGAGEDAPGPEYPAAGPGAGGGGCQEGTP